MKRYIFIGGICLFFTLAAFDPAHAQKIVQAQGTAAIQNGFVDIARDRAISDAQRRVVEQAVGVMITNETIVENFQVLSDKILSQSRGYIQSYDMISEGREGDIYKVTIQAKVSMGQLKNDLEAIQLVIARKSKPRMMILFNEKAQKDFMAEASMVKYFLSKGFKLVDSEVVKKNLAHENIQALNVDTMAASRIGHRFGAEVIVLCSVETSSNPFRVGDIEMYSNTATVSAKVINVDTSNIITTESETKRLPGIKGFIQPTIEQASELLASKLMNGIVTQWSSELTNTVEVKLFASGFQSYVELNDFKGLLTSEIRGIKEIRQRSYEQGQVELEIELQGNTQDLANDLARLDLNGRAIEISEITQNRVKIKLSPQ
jgi:hypothetical protein